VWLRYRWKRRHKGEEEDEAEVVVVVVLVLVLVLVVVEEVQGHRVGTGVVFGHCVGGRGGLGCRR
jgi:hypothetical protein